MENEIIRSIKLSHIFVVLVLFKYSLGAPSQTYDGFRNVSREWKRKLATKEGYFTNTWAVELEDPAEEHVLDISKRHGFAVIGKVG
jgi:hypothetical protein